MQSKPAFHRSRNRHAVNALTWHCLYSVLRQKFRIQGFRRWPGRIQTGELPGPGVPVNDEKIAADTRHHRFREPEQGIGGDRSVRGRAPARQHLRSRLRGQDLARGNDPLLADYHGAPVVAGHLRMRRCGTNETQAGKRECFSHRFQNTNFRPN